jgi:hypothetical protein
VIVNTAELEAPPEPAPRRDLAMFWHLTWKDEGYQFKTKKVRDIVKNVSKNFIACIK